MTKVCALYSIGSFPRLTIVIERDRLRTLRENLANRRRTLTAAIQQPSCLLDHSQPRQSQELTTLSNALARARSGLVQELVEVFNVVEVGGRPPIGGKAGTKGEWTIGDLVLPVPGRYSTCARVIFHRIIRADKCH